MGETKISSDDFISPLGDADIVLKSGTTIVPAVSGVTPLASSDKPLSDLYAKQITVNEAILNEVVDSNVTNIAFVSGLADTNTGNISTNTTNITFVSGVADSALQDIVDDTSPQLGANLDVNNFQITSSIGDIELFSNSSAAGIYVYDIATGGNEILIQSQNADIRLDANDNGDIHLYGGDVILESNGGIGYMNIIMSGVTTWSPIGPVSSGNINLGTADKPFGAIYTDNIIAAEGTSTIESGNFVLRNEAATQTVIGAIEPATSGNIDFGGTDARWSGVYTDRINDASILFNVFMEEPTGDVNGTNKTFTLVNAPVVDSLHLFQNGLLMMSSGVHSTTADYVLSDATITFIDAPPSGVTLIAGSYSYV